MIPFGVGGKSVLIFAGHVNVVSRFGVYVSIVTLEPLVVVYAFLRLSYSGYGVNTHGMLSWSQSSGWKYPTPNLPASVALVSAAEWS